MAAHRPYFRLSIVELEALARQSLAQDDVIQGIIAELTNRSQRGAAKRLHWRLTEWRRARTSGDQLQALASLPPDDDNGDDHSSQLISTASASPPNPAQQVTPPPTTPPRNLAPTGPTVSSESSAGNQGGPSPSANGGRTAPRKTDLERSRQSLLDIRANNPLINCPLLLHSNDWKGRGADRFRILGTPDKVIARLIDKDDDARIYALDPEEMRAWKQSGRRNADSGGADDGAGLRQAPETILKHLQDGHLALETDIETAQAALARLLKAQGTREREIGDSAMFLVFACLHWPVRDSTGNSKSVVSPLLVMHVSLARSTSAQGGRPVYTVTHDGDGLQDNQSLLMKFHQEHGIKLPEWRSGVFAGMKDYLTRLEQLVGDVAGAKIHGSMALGQFHFANYRMWMDLDSAEWRGHTPPGQHPLVSHLLSNTQIPSFQNVELRDAENRAGVHQSTHDLPVITECDSSQYHTVMRIADGDSLITIGPPGTGKSQTIVNAIACLMASGKSVLFVAQKTAALTVVFERLQRANLGDQVLPIFSKDATARKILDRLNKAARSRRGRDRNPVQPSAPQHRIRQLNAYAEVLDRSHDAGGQISKVVRKGIVAAERIAGLWSGFLEERPQIVLGSLPLNPTWWEERRSALRSWAAAAASGDRVWSGWIPDPTANAHIADLRDLLRKAFACCVVLREIATTIQAPALTTVQDLERIATQIGQLPGLVPLSNIHQVLLDTLRVTAAGYSREVDDLQRSVATWHQLHERATTVIGVIDVGERDDLLRLEQATTALAALVSHHESIATARHRLIARRAIAEAIIRLQEVGNRDRSGLEAIAGEATWLWSTIDLVADHKPTAHTGTSPRLIPALCRHLAEEPDQLLVAGDQLVIVERLKKVEDAFSAGKIPLDRLPGDHFIKLSDGIEQLRESLPSETPVDRLAAHANHYRTVAALAQDVLSEGAGWMERPVSATSRQLHALGRLTDAKAVMAPSDLLIPVASAWANGIDQARLEVLTETLSTLGQARERGERLLVQLTKPDIALAELSAANQRLAPCLTALATPDDQTMASVNGITERVLAFQSEWDATIPVIAQWADLVGIGRPATLSDLERIGNVQTLIARRIVLAEGASAQRLADPSQLERLAKVRARCQELARERTGLSADLNLDEAGTLAELKILHADWTSYRTSLVRFIPFTRTLLKARIAKLNRGRIPSDQEWGGRVKRLEGHLVAIEEVAGDDAMRAILGTAWRGLATNWSTVDDMISWASALRTAVGDLIDLDKLLAAAPATRSAMSLLQHRNAVAATPGLRADAVAPQAEVILGSIRARLERLVVALQAGVSALSGVGYPAGGTLAGWSTGLQALLDREQLVAKLHSSQAEMPGIDLASIPITAWRSTVAWLATWEECGLHRPSVLETSQRLGASRAAFERFPESIRALQRGIASLPIGVNGKPGGSIHSAARTLGDVLSSMSSTADALHSTPTILGTLPHSPDLTLGQLVAQAVTYAELLNTRERLAPWSRIFGRPLTGDDVGPVADSIAWVKQVRADGATRGLIIWMSSNDTAARMAWWRSLTSEAAKVKALAGMAQRDGTLTSQATLHATTVERWLSDNTAIQERCSAALDVVHQRLRTPQATVQQIVEAISDTREQHAIAERLAPWTSRLGRPAITIHPDLIAAHERFAQAALTLPPWMAQWLLTEHTPAKLTSLMALQGNLVKTRKAVTAAAAGLDAHGRQIGGGPLSTLSWSGCIMDLGDAADVLDEALSGFAAYVEACDGERTLTAFHLGEVVSLGTRALHAHVVDQRRQIKDSRPWAGDLGIDQAITDAEVISSRGIWKAVDGSSLAGVITDLFDWTVDVHLAEHVIEQHPELDTFDAPEHDQCRTKFAAADESVIAANAAYIKQVVLNRPIDPGTGAGRTSDWTGGKLLDKQMALDRKSMRPRQIIQQAGEAMKGYCPCWLMTPAAVAQFLPPGKISFDVVIFDEASQIPPAEAWGAMARAKQVVLVGDPRQMPPSNWFKGEHGGEDDEDDAEMAAQEPAQESILDQAQEVLPSSMLRWHYRSLHHSLIAPANLFSYNGDLLIFPSSVAKSDELGIGWHPVVEGTFQARANIPEAEAIVTWLEPRLLAQAQIPAAERDGKGTSYGVLTMNLRQQQVIEDLLAQRAQRLPELDRFLAEEEDRLRDGRPGFCVKNLENYQGDERDVIVLSFTYGPDKPRGTTGEWSGRKAFSSVNGNAGKRRFNVMITRARKRMEVFSSLFAGDIAQVTDATAGTGIADMKRFLEFAQSGILPDYGHATGRDYDSDFEESVHRFLQERGFDLEPQVGVAEYRIDLALRHPRDPERYILAIECDGRLYHSSRSARDRDRLRERVLRDRGWTFYRIWSTDWFHDANGAQQRLLEAVKRAIQTCG